MSQVSFVQGLMKEFVTNALQPRGVALSALVATSLQLVLVTNVTLECFLLEPIPVCLLFMALFLFLQVPHVQVQCALALMVLILRCCFWSLSHVWL